MRFRAIIIGLLGAILMAAGGKYATDHIPGMRGLVSGHLPVVVFGFLVLFCIAINPLLHRIHKKLELSGKEVAVILAIVLAACSIPTGGLMRYYPRTLIHPVINNEKEPGWQKAGLLEQTPSVLLVNGGKFDNNIVSDYMSPMGQKGHPIPLSSVPWHVWRTPLLVWGAIIIMFLLGALGLNVLVHRQWANQERLRYPLALIATSMLKRDDDGKVSLFKVRGFWIAAGVIFTIRIINGLHKWFPDFIEIPYSFDLSMLKDKFPEFMAIPGTRYFMTPTIHPVCVGLTFLLASDIGLSLGLASLLSAIVLYALFSVGVDTSGSMMTGGVLNWLSFGSFLAMAIMLVYSGRRYYWQSLKEAVTFKEQKETGVAEVWGMRVFLFCMVGITVILSAVGLDWPVAIGAVFLVMLTYVVCARMVAECGTFFFAPGWMMPGVLVGLFGATTLGPKPMIILGLMFYIMTFDPFDCLMPYVANGLKITSDAGIKVGRMALLIGLGLVLALAIAVPASLWADYNKTPDLRHGGDSREIYNGALQVHNQLSLSDDLDKVNNFTTWQRLRNLRPDKKFIISAGVGFLLLLAFSAARLRFSWWPLHPVLFLGFGSWTMGKFGFSFFMGWMIRTIINKFAGPPTYMKMRPIVLGIILGDLLGGFAMLLVGWLYYAIAGTTGTSAHMW